MGNLTKSFLVIVTVFLGSYLMSGSASGVTVTVETSSGATTSATYYTQDGDWATGDANISSDGSIGLTTRGSVQMGLVRAGSGDDTNKAFSPYTGDFSASAGSPVGGGGTTSANSSNPRADIFVVSQPGNSTMGNYAIDGIPGTPYGNLHDPGADNGAVDAAGGENNSLPDWILVDQGTYPEQVVMHDGVTGAFEDNSALTSVWGADHTIIDATGLAAGPGVGVLDVDSFRVEGFTVQGGVKDGGIDIHNSPHVQIICNTVTDWAGDGIQVTSSNNAQITNNTTTANVRNGIFVTFSDGARIMNNTTANNQWNGINVKSSAGVRITGNSITDNGSSPWEEYGGIYLEGGEAAVDGLERGVPLATITGNNIAGNQNYGLWNNTEGSVVNATNNWWGQPPTRYQGNLTVGAPGSMDADIWDAGLNSVDYQPFAISPFPLL